METGKTRKYFKYAIGEILLVVIGILIALQINNWNEDRKAQAKVLDIYKQILFDLNNDISELTANMEYYENIKPIFEKVVSDTRTVELLDDGLSRLMSNPGKTNFNKSGIERLKSISEKDFLSLRLIELYDSTDIINDFEKGIFADINELANTMRANYNWYPEWISKTITKDNSSRELQDYFVNSQEYRNYVTGSYQDIYNNYIPELKRVIPILKNVLEKLELQLNE